MADYQTDASAWYPEAPKDQVEQVQAEERDALQHLQSSVGVITDVLQWFDTKIAFYGSIDSISISESTPESEAKLRLLLATRLHAQYSQQRKEFIDAFSDYMTES